MARRHTMRFEERLKELARGTGYRPKPGSDLEKIFETFYLWGGTDSLKEAFPERHESISHEVISKV